MPLLVPTSAGSNLPGWIRAVADTVNGLVRKRLVETTISAATTLTDDYDVYLCDATDAAFTVTLPKAGLYSGKLYYLKKIDSSANAITIDADGSETIDGSATQSIDNQYQTITLFSDGTGWNVVPISPTLGTVSVTNGLTFNTSGGAAPGTAFDGSAAVTVDYSTVGALADTAALDDLSDVAAQTPSDGDVLTYVSANDDWEPVAPSGGGGVSPIRPGGRLTLVSSTPVLASDQTAKAAIYYTPYQTDLIPIYGGSAWSGTTFTELTLTLDTTNHVSGSIYDVFVWNNSGTASIGTGPSWTSSTSRGTGVGTTELQMKNGIWTNKNSITLKNGAGAGTSGITANTATYVGTFYATANGQTGMAFRPSAAAGGSANILGLYNAYNRVPVSALCRDSTTSWTYASTTWRGKNNSTSNRVSFVDGLQQSRIVGTNVIFGSASANAWVSGMALDSTTSAPQITSQSDSTGGVQSHATTDNWSPQLGFHFVQAMEAAQGGATLTAFGNITTAPVRQTGMTLQIEM